MVIRPAFYFHHAQPPFLLRLDFIREYLQYPGGVSELIASFLMQSFHNRFLGPVILFLTAFVPLWLTVLLLNTVYKDPVNIILALFPFSLVILLTNNYNFPISVVISLIFVLLFTLLPARTDRGIPIKLILFTIGAVIIYYLSGSGFLILFGITTLFFTVYLHSWKSILYPVLIPGISTGILLLASNYIFALPHHEEFFYFFPDKPYFLTYAPSCMFYLLLASPLILFILLSAFRLLNNRMKFEPGDSQRSWVATFIFILIIGASIGGHVLTFSSDARKMVASDYFCYSGQAEKTARAATSMENYSFAANVCYNLAMSRAGILTDSFFNFFQIRGTYALEPDVEFASDMSFIAADYYYDLGFISEARHWAYESLVNFPYSLRAMKLLVKIHIITGEYKAAERYLNILASTLVDRPFIDTCKPFLKDTSLISSSKELSEKRNSIPEEGELNPSVETRLKQLLDANKANRTAYEYLMIYYLLGNRLDKFMGLLPEAGDYFDKLPAVYEEAILLYEEKYQLPVDHEYRISNSTLERYAAFNKTIKQYEDKPRMARNVLYWDMGKTYLYYVKFVFPRIVLPETNIVEDDEPRI